MCCVSLGWWGTVAQGLQDVLQSAQNVQVQLRAELPELDPQRAVSAHHTPPASTLQDRKQQEQFNIDLQPKIRTFLTSQAAVPFACASQTDYGGTGHRVWQWCPSWRDQLTGTAKAGRRNTHAFHKNSSRTFISLQDVSCWGFASFWPSDLS